MFGVCFYKNQVCHEMFAVVVVVWPMFSKLFLPELYAWLLFSRIRFFVCFNSCLWAFFFLKWKIAQFHQKHSSCNKWDKLFISSLLFSVNISWMPSNKNANLSTMRLYNGIVVVIVWVWIIFVSWEWFNQCANIDRLGLKREKKKKMKKSLSYFFI